MRSLRRFLIRLFTSATTRRDEDVLREELEQHIALLTAEHVRAGVPPDEARRRAAIKVGSVEAIKEQYRDEQTLPALDHFLQDVRYTLRQSRRAPLFSLVAASSLAIGIGANAAVFTVIERVLLRPLPVPAPHELVYVTDQRILTEHSPRFSYPFYEAFRNNPILNGVAARASLGMNADVNGHVARITGELVSGTYFSVLGVGSQIGRLLTPDDDRTPGAHPVAVISDAFWRRSCGADRAVLGRAIRINAQTFTIVGVAARGFSGTDVGHPTDIWLPMVMQREIGRDLLTEPRTNWLEIIGRLGSGLTLERAGVELTAYFSRRAPDLQATFPDRRLLLVPGDKGSAGVRAELGPALAVLMSLTGLALVLASVNVASLLTVRSAAREREIAVRLALGAGRSRLVRQFLTETLILAALGGTAGLLLAPWAARLLIASQPHPLAIDATLDLRVFLFGLACTLVTGLLVGQAPILASRQVGIIHAFENSFAKAFVVCRRAPLRDVVVALQIAISLAMLASAGLLVRSLRTLNTVDHGFRADNLLLISMDPRAAGYDASRVQDFWQRTLDRVSQVHGVETASLGRMVPFGPGRQRQKVLDPISGEFIEIDGNVVGPRYFRTLGIPVVNGREFDEHDTKSSRQVLIVNERLARMFWADQDPIGKRLRVKGIPGDSLGEVIGVVKDVRYRDLRADIAPMFYRPMFLTRSTDPMTLQVRVGGDVRGLLGTIRREVQSLDPTVPLFGITTLEEQLNASFAQTRQAAVLTGAFGVLALLLTAIGVYGVTALAVAHRTRDIGIRMALGAQPRDIVRLIGRRAMTLVIAGLTVGVLVSLAFTQVTGSLLYGVTPGDSATFAAMSALLAIVSLIAFYIPARTATRLDAATAIRYE